MDNPLNLTQDEIETLMRGDDINIMSKKPKAPEPAAEKKQPIWQYFLRTPESRTFLQKTVSSIKPLRKDSVVIYNGLRYKVCTIGTRTLNGKLYRTATIKRIKDVQK